jgi:hypothetical protein
MTEKEKPLSNDALAGEFEKGSERSLLSGRVHRYGVAKSRQLEILNHIDHFVQQEPAQASAFALDRISPRIHHCGNYLVFNHYYTVDKVRLAKADFCKTHLLCPLCAIRRGAKQVQAYMEKMNLLLQENPRLKPYMLTLTVKNGYDLSERFEHLSASMKKLQIRRRDALRGKWTSELSKAFGGVFSYELTKSEHGWHPHVHMVVLCDPNDPIDFDLRNPKESQLSKEWFSVTGDSFIVDFRPIHGDPVMGFVEVFKYALKFSDLSPQENLSAYLALKGRRLTGSFGLFRDVQVPEEMTDDLYTELPFIELFYRYTKQGYSMFRVNDGQTGDSTQTNVPEYSSTRREGTAPAEGFTAIELGREPKKLTDDDKDRIVHWAKTNFFHPQPADLPPDKLTIRTYEDLSKGW